MREEEKLEKTAHNIWLKPEDDAQTGRCPEVNVDSTTSENRQALTNSDKTHEGTSLETLDDQVTPANVTSL